MNVGDRIKFPFAGKEMEGSVVKIFPKKVYLKADFPNHPGKIIIRSLAQLEGKVSTAKKKKKKEKPEKKGKAPLPKEKAEEDQE